MSNNCSNKTALDGINCETKRKRGRPKGSKNKPKSQPAILGRSVDDKPTCCSSFHTHLIEISEGSDVADAIITFARTHRGGQSGGVFVLSASGPIATACVCFTSLCQPMLLNGPCQLLSMTAIFLPGGDETMSACFGQLQGQVIWGKLAGPLMAAGKVVVVVATFGTSEAAEGGNVWSRLSDVESVARAADWAAADGVGNQSDKHRMAAAYFHGGVPSPF
ncbi:hypothetical protein HPP92_009135 [Vanilla planifolia]|uniref:PPC domain-containing protein n=1 Tax=Vanilla planifolia TaxID=51239 RepID=A0A835R7M7_VANPL|nr:hypothetical protein HPP92_009135 [Vanilla planifolia]